MSSDEKLIDFSAERAKRIHDLNDKRLEEMRKTFRASPAAGQGEEKGQTLSEEALIAFPLQYCTDRFAISRSALTVLLCLSRRFSPQKPLFS